jgi:hypothetical protein
LDKALKPFFAEAQAPEEVQTHLRCAALLWHDHLSASHRLSQSLSTREGSFLHGIMHRREPDYSNAKYWFHRVGAHPCFPAIAKLATRLLGPSDPTLLSRLAPNGIWDPFRFIDACEEAETQGQPDPSELKKVQEIEFGCLLERLFRMG